MAWIDYCEAFDSVAISGYQKFQTYLKFHLP